MAGDTYKFPMDDPGQEGGVDFSQQKPPPDRNIEPLDAVMQGEDLGPGYQSRWAPQPAQLRNHAQRAEPPVEERVFRNYPVLGDSTVETLPDGTVYDGMRYDPADTNQDGIVSEIERYMAQQQMSPQQRQRQWIEQNVWSKGYTVDMGTGEIVDPQSGQAVGRLPQFE